LKKVRLKRNKDRWVFNTDKYGKDRMARDTKQWILYLFLCETTHTTSLQLCQIFSSNLSDSIFLLGCLESKGQQECQPSRFTFFGIGNSVFLTPQIPGKCGFFYDRKIPNFQKFAFFGNSNFGNRPLCAHFFVFFWIFSNFTKVKIQNWAHNVRSYCLSDFWLRN
jgi:ABC-type uncharacterized transport system permease subunit